MLHSEQKGVNVQRGKRREEQTSPWGCIITTM